MPTRLAIPLLVLALAAAGCARRSAPVPESPTRIAIVIADGAGLAHWSAARLSGHDLEIADFPVVGLVEPGNVSGDTPESASVATAYATGARTSRDAIGVGPDGRSRTTALEAAEAGGLATGLVTTSTVTDATPAAFVAHVGDRALHEDIARQIASRRIDVVLGGGRRFFDPAQRSDSLDLLGALRRGYLLVEDSAALEAALDDPPERLFGLFDLDVDSMGPDLRNPSLESMTRAALAVLDRDPDGFFLLIENEGTDASSHRNEELASIVSEMLDVDHAVRALVEYRRRRPDTLVVVLSDHETGGLALLPSEGGLVARYATGHHTAELVPVFAVGPGAERFGGVFRDEELGRRLRGLVDAARAD